MAEPELQSGAGARRPDAGEPYPEGTYPGGPLVMRVGEWFLWVATAVSLPMAGVLLVAAAERLASLRVLTPVVFATTHTFTLALGSMAIMGAAYQMSSALLGARVWGERWVPLQFGAFAVGVASLVTGFWRSSLLLLIAGGSLVTLGAWAFVVIMLRTTSALRERRSHSGGRRIVHGVAMALSVFCFGLVTAWGLVLASSFRYPFWPALHVHYRGLLVHLALGFGGWFALMVIGVSYRLVPILHGARIASERRGFAITGLLSAAILATIAGALAGVGVPLRLAAAAAAAAGPLYVWEIVRLLRHRRKAAPDLNVDHWLAVSAYTLALSAAAIGWAAGWLRTEPPERLGIAAAVLFLLGFVVQAFLGQVYKVTPFLMWYYRARIPDVLEIPKLPDLYAPLPGRAAFWLTNAGTVLVAGGVVAGAAPLSRLGALLFTAGAALIALMLGYAWVPAVVSGRLPFRWRRAGARTE